MHQLIASYLFQNKACPLPGLGTLFIHVSGAEADFTNKLISGPKPLILFEHTESDASGLLGYVSGKTHSNIYEVTEALDHLCDKLRHEISNHMGAKLEGVGNFLTDNNGNTIFKQEELPAVFLQPVFAERVVHPKAEHQILVGDKETTNTIMTEYFKEEPVVKDRWLVWAVIIVAISLIVLLFYFSDKGATAAFGNAFKI